jgi:pimeloyl-ACP methyl ester carboxylesterase
MELRVPVDGGYLWADDSGGEGVALVLLHPGWGDSSIWLPVLERLPSHYRVIRYDTRGFGKSPAPAAPFSQLGDLAVVLDHRGADRVLLVGHSGGGGTAIGLALADPARVHGLLLLAPGVHDYPWPPDDPYGRQFDELYAAGDRDGLADLGLRTWAAAGADQAAQEQIRGAADAYFRVGDYERPGPPAYSRLGQILTPAVVIAGDQEYPMVARCAADIAIRIPDCQQIPAPGADHMLPLRVPAMTAELAGQLASEDPRT